MGKDKLRRFAENLTFECFVQPAFEEAFRRDHPLKGHWHSDFFHNDRPIVLELGCGKGEYTVALAERDPNRNFIGIDIKGARMWRGAKTATERQMRNVGFLRTRIEMIASFFAEGEVDEIWITFPDPQLKSRRAKKRLTSPLFLGQYAQMLIPGGRINLKTDSQHLYAYTQAVIERFGLPCDVANNDIYGSGFADEILSVKTAYEQMFLERKLPITYTRFSLGERRDFPPFDWEGDDTDEKDNEEARKTIYPTEPPDHHTQIHKSRIPYPEYMSLKILHHRHIRQGVPLHRKKSDSRRIYANPHTDRNLKRTVNKALEAVDLILRTSNNGVFF